jgi:hypothetical protein
MSNAVKTGVSSTAEYSKFSKNKKPWGIGKPKFRKKLHGTAQRTLQKRHAPLSVWCADVGESGGLRCNTLDWPGNMVAPLGPRVSHLFRVVVAVIGAQRMV